jgi:uncharacterized protein YjiK
MSRTFDPVSSSTHDGEDITLCRILEAVSGTAYNYALSNYATADKPGTIVISDTNGNTISTLTLSYDGSNNLTSVVRS